MAGWYDLLSIYQEQVEDLKRNDARPSACPHDGTPLQEGPNGLFCPWDGWKYDK